MTQNFPLDPTQYPTAAALFEALAGWKPVDSRVRIATIAACCVLVTGEAITGREAAQICGISDRNLYRFRSSKSGRLLFERLRALYRTNAGWQAVLRIQQLAKQDKNLSVAMRAAEWLAGISGISPTAKTEVLHRGEASSVGMMVIHPDAATPELLAQIFPQPKDDPTRH